MFETDDPGLFKAPGHRHQWDLRLEGVGIVVALGNLALDFAEGVLILLDVVAQGEEKVLGVLGVHDHAGVYAGLGHVGGNGDEVDEELTGGVGDDGQVGIVATGYFGSEFDFDFLLFVVFCHDSIGL